MLSPIVAWLSLNFALTSLLLFVPLPCHRCYPPRLCRLLKSASKPNQLTFVRQNPPYESWLMLLR